MGTKTKPPKVTTPASNMIESSEKGDETLVALGKKFSGLELEDMKVIVQETKFYKTPAAGIELFGRSDFQTQIMPKVVDFWISHEITPTKPSIGFKPGGGEQLIFDSSYMTKVQ